jgi:hypothetical protein
MSDHSSKNSRSSSLSRLGQQSSTSAPSTADTLKAILAKLTHLDSRVNTMERDQPVSTPVAQPPQSMSGALNAMASPRTNGHGRGRARAPTPARGSLGETLLSAMGSNASAPFRNNRSSAAAVSDSGSAHENDAQAESGSDDRQAVVIMNRLLKTHRNALDFVQRSHFANIRSMHEARRIAQAIDAFTREGIDLHHEGMEILVRNLAGLHMADQHSDPSLLEHFEWDPPTDIVPRDILRTVFKDAKRNSKFKPSKKKTPADPKKGAGAGK